MSLPVKHATRETGPVSLSIPIVAPGHTPGTVTDKISAVVLAKTPKWWFPAFAVAFALLNLFFIAVGYLFLKGIGIWGINIPIAWGGTSSISSGGSGSATPARSFRRSCSCSARNGGPRSTASRRR